MSETRPARRGHLASLLKLIPRRSGSAIVVLFLIAALLDGVSVGLILPFLSVIGGGGQDADSHRVLGVVINLFARAGLPFGLATLLALIGVSALLRTLVTYAGIAIQSRLIERLLVRLRLKIVSNFLRVSPSFYATRRGGELAQGFLEDIEKTGFAIGHAFKIVAGIALVLVWTLIMLVFSWRLTLLAALVSAALTVLVRLRVSYSSRLGAQIADAKRAMTGRIIELLSAVRVVWLSSTETFEIDRVGKSANRVADLSYRFARNTAFVNLIGENFATFALLGIVYLSVDRLNLSMATLVSFFFVMSRVLPMVHRLNVVRTELGGFLGHVDTALTLASAEDKPYVSRGSEVLPRITQGIAFRDVWFSYRPDEPVLRGVSLDVRRGETVALAGASGAGKSTIIDLLSRFYEPVKGAITVDGKPLASLALDNWRRKLGVVSQDVFLFSDTVAANIAYGAGPMTREDIEAISRTAHAHEFIAEMPQGYDTVLGDRGATMSGGQRQRIALARALARKPEVLILDEATSALDSESERFILDAIEKLAGHLTIIVIGHRLATLRKADRIYVLEAGRIVETGQHDELISAGGRYAQYCALQRV